MNKQLPTDYKLRKCDASIHWRLIQCTRFIFLVFVLSLSFHALAESGREASDEVVFENIPHYLPNSFELVEDNIDDDTLELTPDLQWRQPPRESLQPLQDEPLPEVRNPEFEFSTVQRSYSF